MHAWSRFVREYLDTHGMRPAELARKTGVSPQVLSNLLNDRRDQLDRRPDPKTVALLAKGMNVDESVLLSKIGEAMGLPVAEHVVVYSASRVSDDELIRELATRLRKRGETGGDTAATSEDDEIGVLLTLNPAASDADGDEDPDAEVEEQQREP